MPEDKFGDNIAEIPDENAINAHTRWSKIIQNDIENIPMGLILNWGSLLCNANPAYHLGLNCMMVFGRVMHTVSYAYGLMPHRSLAYFAGMFASLGFIINGINGSKLMDRF